MNEKKDKQSDHPFSLPSPAESKAGFDYCDAFNEPRVCRFHEPSLSNTPPRPEAKWSFDHRNISPGPHKDPTATRINDAGLTGRYDEQRYHERSNYRGTVGPGFFRPREPVPTKEFLKGSEVTDADPFNFEGELTGRYDEQRFGERHTIRPRRGGSNPVGLFNNRPPDFPEIHEENSKRFNQSGTDRMEYCPTCQGDVPKEIMEENPGGTYPWPQVCSFCAVEIRKNMLTCPQCGSYHSASEFVDNDFPRCDRCGCSGCDCLNWQRVPHTFGAWMDEEYDRWDTVCGDCYKRTEEEHDRHREEELERSNEESMNTESTNKQMEE